MTSGTEDDTYRVLIRPKFEDMVRIHKAWWESIDSMDQRLRIPFMIAHGWTWLEFVKTAEQKGVGSKV